MLAVHLCVNKSYTEFDTNQTNHSDADIGSATDRQIHGWTDGRAIYVRLYPLPPANRLPCYWSMLHVSVVVVCLDNPTQHIKLCVGKIYSLY